MYNQKLFDTSHVKRSKVVLTEALKLANKVISLKLAMRIARAGMCDENVSLIDREQFVYKYIECREELRALGILYVA